LRQYDHRLGAAIPGGRDVALQPAQAEVVVEAGEQEGGVDVRGEDLLVRAEAGTLADERAPPRQDRRDRGSLFRARNCDPVADGGNRASDLVLVEDSAGRAGAELPVLGPDGVSAAMLRGDAGG